MAKEAHICGLPLELVWRIYDNARIGDSSRRMDIWAISGSCKTMQLTEALYASSLL